MEPKRYVIVKYSLGSNDYGYIQAKAQYTAVLHDIYRQHNIMRISLQDLSNDVIRNYNIYDIGIEEIELFSPSTGKQSLIVKTMLHPDLFKLLIGFHKATTGKMDVVNIQSSQNKVAPVENRYIDQKVTIISPLNNQGKELAEKFLSKRKAHV